MTQRPTHDWASILAMTAVLVAAGLILSAGLWPALPREAYLGQYAQVDPALRDWYGRQRAPGSRVPCCSDADGARADEDRRGNATWTRFTYVHYVHRYDGDGEGTRTETRTDWMEVPEDAIIRGGDNPTGNPVVWYRTEGRDGEVVKIRCYKPAIDG